MYSALISSTVWMSRLNTDRILADGQVKDSEVAEAESSIKMRGYVLGVI